MPESGHRNRGRAMLIMAINASHHNIVFSSVNRMCEISLLISVFL